MKEKLLALFKKENVQTESIEFDGDEFLIKMSGELNYIRARRFIKLNNWIIETNGYKQNSFYIEGSFADKIASESVTSDSKISDEGIVYKCYRIKILPVDEMGYHYSIGSIKFTERIHYSVEELLIEAKDRVDGLTLKSSEMRKKAIASSKINESSEKVLTLAEMEREHIRHVLEVNNENRLRSAKALDLSPRTLRNKIGHYAKEGDIFFNRLYKETEHMGPRK